MTILYGEPLEVGREIGCLADNVERALLSENVADLGHPTASNPLIKNAEANALLYFCQAEHCQLITKLPDCGRIVVSSPCSFGTFRSIDEQGEYIQGQYEIPEINMLTSIVSACANRSETYSRQQG